MRIISKGPVSQHFWGPVGGKLKKHSKNQKYQEKYQVTKKRLGDRPYFEKKNYEKQIIISWPHISAIYNVLKMLI